MIDKKYANLLPERLRATVLPVAHLATASSQDIHMETSADVFTVDSLSMLPSFYPVYKWREYFSYSPLPLILFKRELNLNPIFIAKNDRRIKKGYAYYSGNETIDREIVRIGGPVRPTATIRTSDAFLGAFVEAMQFDATAVEDRFPGATNYILCGGKDSLNMLLLKWKNPVVVLSAQPNYPLVEEFVEQNKLNFEVRELIHSEERFETEVLAGNCLIDLTHCRWVAHLSSISAGSNHSCVFWAGSLADILLTQNWKTYTHQRFGRLNRIRSRWGLSLGQERYVRSSLYWRGAMWQGAHHGLLRAALEAPVLSGYHGSRMTKLLANFRITDIVSRDFREDIGTVLFGREVWYPMSNPGPTPANRSAGVSVDLYVGLNEGLGVSVVAG